MFFINAFLVNVFLTTTFLANAYSTTAVSPKTSLRSSFQSILAGDSIVLFENGNIFNTKNTYNGTLGYNGFYDACSKEKSGSTPCTSTNLIDSKFWNMEINPSWILDLSFNCVGYSSDDENTIGLCVQTLYGKQVIPCSCNMKISVCCYFS